MAVARKSVSTRKPVFDVEPDYKPEAAQAASLRMEQTSPTYKAFKDKLRKDAADVQKKTEKSVATKYSPDQARDDHGRWTDGSSQVIPPMLTPNAEAKIGVGGDESAFSIAILLPARNS